MRWGTRQTTPLRGQMIKVVLMSLALVFAFSSVSAARYADDFSGARRTKVSDKQSYHKRAHYKYARRHAGERAGGGRTGEAACGADARRLCRSVIGQGDSAVLGCFQANARRLSGGCRTLLRGYGQI